MSDSKTKTTLVPNELITDNLNIKLEIESIKKKLGNHSKNIELVFNYLDELIDKKEKLEN